VSSGPPGCMAEIIFKHAASLGGEAENLKGSDYL
jgi:hypothetical protein